MIIRATGAIGLKELYGDRLIGPFGLLPFSSSSHLALIALIS